MNEKFPPTIMIKNCNFTDTWALANYAVNKYGIVVPSSPNYTNNPDYNSPLIKEIIISIEHNEESIQQMLNKTMHSLYPQKNGINEYINQLIPGTEEYNQGKQFHYTYGRRLRKMECSCYVDKQCVCKIDSVMRKCKAYTPNCYIDQLSFVAEHLDPFNKRMQSITWIPEIDLHATIVDEMKQSVPCMQRLRLENYYDKYYTMILNWRSRDLYKAFMMNDIGLIVSTDRLIKQKRKELNLPELKLVKVVEFVDSLHVYEQDWENSKKIPIDAETINNCLFI